MLPQTSTAGRLLHSSIKRYLSIGHPKRSILSGHPGQNLSERFKLLENAIIKGPDLTPIHTVADTHSAPVVSSEHHLHTFHGLRVPQEPKPLADDECCMSGCAICVYDRYEESLAAYKDRVHAFRQALTLMNIAEAQWPAHIRFTISKAADSTEALRKEKIIQTFDDMERTLALKKRQRLEKSTT